MTKRDPTKEQPERFKRAVRADCGSGCNWPDCGHTAGASAVRRAIIAWEKMRISPDDETLEFDQERPAQDETAGVEVAAPG